ncbi:DUF554 domain-containing protein [Marinitenerispora sediminis]|uniref:DUF554 domain-containing protein n=1 Tax=Marinitenerispora sediminis TaxID=1931232 RepID=A0A368TA32_9ACTN|nr:DUF554 family protein [Marinitenerispora sediminis]RCV51672.1 DUF554 domain-containing protein [Marinitenerispora sediminis]RCV59470.1 DUF554 domain-containing protein [Marinitenerispora sediminis]RCV61707.1 DUF554 domain-containing protein [Marinitenerispora sediminis]
MPGLGTLINVAAIVAGAAVGMALGGRLPDRTRQVVTDALGLVVLLTAALSAASVLDPALTAATGSAAPTLIVLGSLLIGGIAGSLLRVEARLEQLGEFLRRLLTRAPAPAPQPVASSGAPDAAGAEPSGAEPSGAEPVPPAAGSGAQQRFVEGFVSSSLVFVVGPLAILGAISDGLGNGIDQLALKAALDGFAAVAFAAALGVGVMASAGPVLVYQGAFTVLGVVLGSFLPEAHVAALTATGGLLLVGVGLRLLRIRSVPVADMLPALFVAPVLTAVAAAL